jgi:DNA-binding response OmpR family regulator
MRVLLVEDNRRMNTTIRLSLEEAGYAVDPAYTGPDGEEMAQMAPYDAIILDIMLPGKDGLAVCRELRRNRVNTPVLMLTARDAIDDRVSGLDSGADDYLVKPFALEELHARLRALLRRESGDKSGQLRIQDLVLDPATRYVTRAGKPVDLTAKEYGLLEYFMRNPNRLITREMAVDHIWSYDFEATSNIIDVYIRRLRAKIDAEAAEKLFETVRGAGYRLRDPDRPGRISS